MFFLLFRIFFNKKSVWARLIRVISFLFTKTGKKLQGITKEIRDEINIYSEMSPILNIDTYKQ